MQLKLKRSQRDAGVLSKSVVFCLDARVVFSAAETGNIQRYKLHNQVIYNSAASERALAAADAHMTSGTMVGSLRSLASSALAGMKLNISISSLQQGQHIECKSLEELLAAEEAILDACRNLKAFLDTAATFDGRETVVDFSSSAPQVVATAAPSPEPVLVEQAGSIPPPEPTVMHREAFAAEGTHTANPGMNEEDIKQFIMVGVGIVVVVIAFLLWAKFKMVL